MPRKKKKESKKIAKQKDPYKAFYALQTTNIVYQGVSQRIVAGQRYAFDENFVDELEDEKVDGKPIISFDEDDEVINRVPAFMRGKKDKAAA